MCVELYDEYNAGWWSASLAESRGPQERVQRRTVEQIADFTPMVQILGLPAPPVVLGGVHDQILQRIVEQDFADDTEQEIAVPVISRPTSTSCCSSCSADGGTVGGRAGALLS